MPMLIGNKKSQQNNQNWCVILNPVKNEIDKKKIVEKISQVFSLSREEAGDLVSNTPIILLDNLTEPIASQLKNFFRSSGAELTLTNDVFLKRKCYRTVWPTPPNLAFLHPVKREERSLKQESVEQDHEMLGMEEALDEIRSLSEPVPAAEPLKSFESASPFKETRDEMSEHERSRLLEEIDRLKERCSELEAHRHKLSGQLEKTRAAQAEQADQSSKNLLKEKDRELKELRTLLSNAEEKYEILKNEFRETRSVYEEKISKTERLANQSQEDISGLKEKCAALEEEKAILTGLLDQQKNESQKLRSETEAVNKLRQQIRDYENQIRAIQSSTEKEANLKTAEIERLTLACEKSEQELAEAVQENTALNQALDSEKNHRLNEREAYEDKQNAQESMIHTLQDKLQTAEEESRKFRSDLQNVRQMLDKKITEAGEEAENWRQKAEALQQDVDLKIEETEDLQRMLSKMEEKNLRLQKDFEEKIRSAESQLSGALNELTLLRKKHEELAVKLAETEALKMESEAKGQELASQVDEWRSQSEHHALELRVIRRAQTEEKNLREQAEAREKEYEKSQARLLSDAEAKNQALREAEAKQAETETRLRELQESYDGQQKVLGAHLKELETREREIETLRRQMRELAFQNEQREATQKKLQLANQLTEKENNLKKLIQDQQKIESEIREREEAMRSILAGQEQIEKEIIECKQARRHLIEQSKREKNGKVKVSRFSYQMNGGKEDEAGFEQPAASEEDERTSAE